MLPEGWRFIPARLAGLVVGPDQVPLDPEDTFTFDCVGGPGGYQPECCGHADTCGHTGVHQVGAIKWTHDAGRWQCPWLRDGACAIWRKRPISCRLFPLGLSIFREVSAIAIWKQKGVEQTCGPCHRGRLWTVREWLEHNDIETLLPPAIASHRSEI